jgi:hypothetical protein
MKRNRPLVIACMLLSAVFAAWPWPSVPPIPVPVAARGAVQGVAPWTAAQARANSSAITTGRETRQSALRELKERWRVVMAKPGARLKTTQEQGELMRETVDRLLPSSELVELLETISGDEGRPSIAFSFEYEVKLLLRSDRAEEALRALVASNDSEYQNSVYYKSWMEFASKDCTAEQAAWMTEAAGDPVSARILAAGQVVQLSQVDPAAAVKSLFERFDGKEVAFEFGNMLDSFSLGEDSDPKELEKLIPVSKTKDDLASEMREKLVYSWGIDDPEGATQFVLGNQERFDPGVMRSLASGVSAKGAKATVEWVQDLPPGRYFDAAMDLVISMIGEDYPKEARELVNQITDPALRKACFSRVDNMESESQNR